MKKTVNTHICISGGTGGPRPAAAGPNRQNNSTGASRQQEGQYQRLRVGSNEVAHSRYSHIFDFRNKLYCF